MKILFSTVLLIFLLQGCSQKHQVELLQSKNIEIDLKQKSLFIEFNNETNENIDFEVGLKKRLEKNLLIVEDKNTKEDFHLLINIPFASKINKKEAKDNILNNVHINIGVGGRSGSFSMYTQIGSSLTKLLSKEFSDELFQMIVDLKLQEYKNNRHINTYTIQILATAPLSFSKQKVLENIEEEVIEEIVKILIKD